MRFSNITLLFFILFSACQINQQKSTYSAKEIDSLKTVFAQYLQSTEKDFKTADWSPLTDSDKAEFEHLDYYTYDVSWRYEGPIHIYDTPDSLKILGSKEGDIRPAIKFGYFEFEREAATHQLQIIKIFPTRPGRQAHLFLGFWDETSSGETYGGGRYINIEENEQNFYIIDFNYAYNPYCAYSSRYSCAVPPLENSLNIAVTAGEKFFKDH